ncbi:CsbD-like [Geosmithia morbida]|uniref:CsbD-like n=1 Tax=Geosmithia morbida TaxID=1094350 RepID=A0A9P5D565_9HYPO|nr:CsbD-like [Geosmithia morbida]KAF4124246.1 CsbD-like [Geosmithia morbida]
MSANDQPSTLQSYTDAAISKVQSGLSAITGNSADQEKSDIREEKAQEEHDASHAAVKVPGGAVSSSGAAVKDDSNRSQGSWNQTIGSAKETVGGLVGNESLKQSGRQQNLEGQEQEAKGQLNDFSSGIANRAQGTIGGAIAGVTGDKKGEEHYDKMRAEGKTQQRGAEHDIRKQSEAREEKKD